MDRGNGSVSSGKRKAKKNRKSAKYIPKFRYPGREKEKKTEGGEGVGINGTVRTF